MSRIRVVLLVLLVAAVSGCAERFVPYSQREASLPSPPAGSGRLFVFMAPDPHASILTGESYRKITASAFVDGKQVHAFAYGSVFFIDLPAGTHSVTGTDAQTERLEVDMRPRQFSYVEAKLRVIPAVVESNSHVDVLHGGAGTMVNGHLYPPGPPPVVVTYRVVTPEQTYIVLSQVNSDEGPKRIGKLRLLYDDPLATQPARQDAK